MAAAIAAVWLTDEPRVVGLVIVPTAIVAGPAHVYGIEPCELARSLASEYGRSAAEGLPR